MIPPAPSARHEAAGLASRLRGWLAGAPSPSAPPRHAHPTAPAVLLLNAPEGIVADFEDSLAEVAPDARLIAHGPAFGDGHAPDRVRIAHAPESGRRAAMRWLEEHAPSLVVWFGSVAPDAMLEALIASEIPALAVDVPRLATSDIRAPRARRLLKSALGHFDVTFTRDGTGARSLRAHASAAARIEVLGPVRAIATPPACSTAERDALAQGLKSRPVWLAAFPDAAEIPAILAAHRVALRGAHRLLLIIAVDTEKEGSSLVTDLRSEGWRAARRGAEGEPEESVEIFVADAPEEIGLWYRLAPTTFLGGTLRGVRLADPVGATTLGSALIVGPRGVGQPTPEGELLTRLSEAGGLSRIANADALAAAVADLLSPDKAAAHAHAAWDTVSDSARILERIVSEVRSGLRVAAR